MEPRLTDQDASSGGEGPTVSREQPQQPRRFQIIKLEERVAPHCGHYNPHGHYGRTCGCTH
jgi:hypothetical protein